MKKLKSFGGYFDLDNKIIEIQKLENEISNENFWNDQKNANEVISKLNSLKNYRDKIYEFKEIIKNKLEEIDILTIENDFELFELIEIEVLDLEKKMSDFELLVIVLSLFDLLIHLLLFIIKSSCPI